MNGIFTTPNIACEEALVDYLIATVNTPIPVTASFYTGYGNIEDLQAPAVFVQSESGDEVAPYMKVYTMPVTIEIKEMAADTATNALGVLAASVFNQMADPNIVTKVNTTNSSSFSAYQIYGMNKGHYRSQDALISRFTYMIVGAISGSL